VADWAGSVTHARGWTNEVVFRRRRSAGQNKVRKRPRG
jgi:hypothetical protein